MALSRLRRESQHLFINGTEVSGVQNVNFAYDQPNQPLSFLGMSTVTGIPSGPQIGNVSISRFIVGNEPFLQFTGYSGFNGYIVKNKNNITENYSFTSGYISSYNSQCSIGQIPQIGVNLVVVGNLGKIVTGESPQTLSDFGSILTSNSTTTTRIAGPNSIDINIDEFNTNRVLSYDININTNRNPIYILGQRLPIDVKIDWPIEILISFILEPDGYSPRKLSDWPCSNSVKNITITLKDYNNLANTLLSYSFANMELISEKYNTAVDGSVSLELVYRKFITE